MATARVGELCDDNSTALQSYIARFLSDELSLSGDQITGDVAFSDYGVDSIMSRRLMRGINDEFGIAVSGRDLIEHGTVGALAAALASRSRPGASDSQPMTDAT